jgi:hypothetical protein
MTPFGYEFRPLETAATENPMPSELACRAVAFMRRLGGISLRELKGNAAGPSTPKPFGAHNDGIRRQLALAASLPAGAAALNTSLPLFAPT